jgi:hypothetical protein
MLQYCHIVHLYKILDQNRLVCWSIVAKEKPNVGSPFFGAFISNRTPKALKNSISLFTVTIPVNYTSEFRKIFEVLLTYDINTCHGILVQRVRYSYLSWY